MALIVCPDPRLARKAALRELDDGLRAIGNRLLRAAAAANAYGLAAIHIGALAPVVDQHRRKSRPAQRPGALQA